jgi:Skp family chaperone for outer membrane proteins
MTMRCGRLAAAAAAVLAAACGAALAQGPPAGPGEIRLAVVDMDRVMVESEMGKAEQANLDKLKGERAGLVNAKQKELEAMEEQIRNASLSWSDEKREDQARQYELRRIELRRLNEDATRDVQAEFNRALAKLQKAALEVTSALGRERGFTMIFEKNTAPVLFATDAIDVTSEVIQRLNAKSRPSAGAAPKPSPGAAAPGGGG